MPTNTKSGREFRTRERVVQFSPYLLPHPQVYLYNSVFSNSLKRVNFHDVSTIGILLDTFKAVSTKISFCISHFRSISPRTKNIINLKLTMFLPKGLNHIILILNSTCIYIPLMFYASEHAT